MIETPRAATLFDTPTEFDGATYVPKHDRERLTGQIERVFDAVKAGDWLTLDEIQQRIERVTGQRDPHASISAQLRHLRKPKFGGYTVEKRHRGDRAHGLYEYRLVIE